MPAVLAVTLAAGLVIAPPVQRPAEARSRNHVVFVSDSGLEPAELDIDLGDRVTWAFTGLVPRQVVEPTFRLFESLPQFSGGTFTWRAIAAGSFEYLAPIWPLGALAHRGRLTIRPRLGTGPGANFLLVWAEPRVSLPADLRFDVQRGIFGRKHGHRVDRWTRLASATRARSGLIPYRCDGLAHGGRVRLRAPDGQVSEWATTRQFSGCIE
jgi:plastocyanin